MPEHQPLRLINARRIRDPQDADEALAVNLLYAEPGELVPLHGGMCLTNIGGDCTCTPRMLVVGAAA